MIGKEKHFFLRNPWPFSFLKQEDHINPEISEEKHSLYSGQIKNEKTNE
jgi:hypothetical protein